MSRPGFDALSKESSRGVPRRGMRRGEAAPRPTAPAPGASRPQAAAGPPPQRPEPVQKRAAPRIPAVLPPNAIDDAWGNLPCVPLNTPNLERHRIIAATREDPAHGTFDVLRSRLLSTLKENGWSRVAITSPTRECGKSFLAANLAISLSRAERVRTVLMDLDLRDPGLAKLLGVADPGILRRFLSGRATVKDHFRRFGENDLGVGRTLALALNEHVESDPAELLFAPGTDAALAAMQEALRPDVVLFDLPPALCHDDLLAFQRHFDGVLLVAGGGVTRAEEIEEVSRRLAHDKPLLGVVLNRAEGATLSRHCD